MFAVAIGRKRAFRKGNKCFDKFSRASFCERSAVFFIPLKFDGVMVDGFVKSPSTGRGPVRERYAQAGG
jgi:hypothetical protein